MWHMKKRIDKKASLKRVHLQESMLLICSSYGSTGINFIAPCFFEANQNNPFYKSSIVLGIVMLCMVSISFFDPRPEMHGRLNTFLCCIMHFALSLWLAHVFLSWWIMILYAVEVAITMSFISLKRAKNRRKRPKKVKK